MARIITMTDILLIIIRPLNVVVRVVLRELLSSMLLCPMLVMPHIWRAKATFRSLGWLMLQRLRSNMGYSRRARISTKVCTITSTMFHIILMSIKLSGKTGLLFLGISLNMACKKVDKLQKCSIRPTTNRPIKILRISMAQK